MSRSVTFNGITRFRPGSISRVNAEQLNQIGVTSGGVMGLIGESTAGAPGSSAGLVSMRDASQATDLFGTGPLVDAIKLAFMSSADPLIPGGAAEVVIYKTNASTTSKVHLPSLTNNLLTGTSTGASTASVLTVTGGGMTINAFTDRWVTVAIAAMAGAPTFLRRVVSNTATTITITPALPQAPANLDTILVRASLIVLTSRQYGLDTASITTNLDFVPGDASYQMSITQNGATQLSTSLGGQLRNYLHVFFGGGAVSVESTTVAAASTVSIVNTVGALTPAAHANKTFVLRDLSGNLVAASKITTNGANSITLAVALSVVPVTGYTAQILATTEALGHFTGASGVASNFVTTITGVTGSDLNIAITAGMTVNQLAAAINANPNYIATVPPAINGFVELATAFDYDATTTDTNMQRSFAGTVSTTGFRQDLKEIVAWINNNAVDLTAVRAAIASGDGSDGNSADYPGSTGDALPWVFALYGGIRGISSNTDFQNGMDKMLLRVVDQVVPLIDQDLTNEGNGSTATRAAVAAQLVDHVTEARGPYGLERGGVTGFRGTKAQFIAACQGLNDTDVQCVAQNPTIVDLSGNLVAKGPRELAVMAASMRLGVDEVGEPLTHKYLKISALTQDATWDPANVTDAGDLILAGAMFAEVVPGKGTRWVRDITTWVKDDNLAFSEGSIRDVVRNVVFGLHTTVEDRFTGRKATPATIASIKDTVASYLETKRTENVIVDSTDPATGATIHAFYGLKVTSSGDIIRVSVGFFPVPGINFELFDLAVSLATQSA